MKFEKNVSKLIVFDIFSAGGSQIVLESCRDKNWVKVKGHHKIPHKGQNTTKIKIAGKRAHGPPVKISYSGWNVAPVYK